VTREILWSNCSSYAKEGSASGEGSPPLRKLALLPSCPPVPMIDNLGREVRWHYQVFSTNNACVNAIGRFRNVGAYILTPKEIVASGKTRW